MGGSYPQIQGVKAIKKAGVIVILIDHHPSAPCAKYADIHLKFSVTDTNSIMNYFDITSNILNIIGIYGISDYTNKTIMKLNKYFRLESSLSTLSNFSNKIKTHRLLEKTNVFKPKLLWSGNSSPDPIYLKKIVSGFNKIVVKPSSSHSSNGMRILETQNISNIIKSIKFALEFSNFALIEEFINGEIVNIDGLKLDKEVYCFSLIKRGSGKINENLNYIFGLNFSEIENKLKFKAMIMTKSLLNILEYKNGPFTIDTILSEDHFYPIEASPHLHAVSFYKNDNKHPLNLWAKFLSSGKLKKSANDRLNIGYLALKVKKNNLKVNENLLSSFLSKEFILDYFRRPKFKANINKTIGSKLAMVFWFKNKSKDSF